MIISVEKLKSYDAFKNCNDAELLDKLNALESLIRSYTNNNFQNRNVRMSCPSKDNCLIGSSTYLKVGDTIQITNSNYNDNLYVIKSIDDLGIKLDKDIYDNDNNVVTKIEYPESVKSVVINILSWELTNGSKMGIQSENIGRHSVTYFNQTSDNSLGGYPLSLFNSLKQYQKARF